MPTKKDDILKFILMLSIDFIIKKHLLNNNNAYSEALLDFLTPLCF